MRLPARRFTHTLLALVVWGTASYSAATPALRFHAQADTLWAEAWLSSQGGQGALTVELHNYTLQPIEMSYVSDEYVAQLRDGSTESLEKADFYNYPTRLGLGEQAAVRLRVPKRHPVRHMTALVIRLEQGRYVLALNRDQPPVRVPDFPPAAPVVPATEPVPVLALPPAPAPELPLRQEPPSAPAPIGEAPVVDAPAPVAAEAVAPAPVPELPPSAPLVPAEWLQRPAADVPVVVEFSQEFGGSLTLQAQWDQAGPTAKVYPEERKVFRVAPGPHTCTLRSEVQGLVPTTAHVPLVIAGHAPVRLIVRGSVTLEGVTLHVEVWNNVTNRLLLERTFKPGA